MTSPQQKSGQPVTHKPQLARQLQVADAATDLVVLGIAGGLPKRSSDVVLIGDEDGYLLMHL
jgi:hypothetical protein